MPTDLPPDYKPKPMPDPANPGAVPDPGTVAPPKGSDSRDPGVSDHPGAGSGAPGPGATVATWSIPRRAGDRARRPRPAVRAASRPSRPPPRQLALRLSKSNGSERRRFPVAAKMAFATAGATGGTPGSPTPVGFSPEGTM